MRNLSSIPPLSTGASAGTALSQLQVKSPVEQLVDIMMRDTKNESPYTLLNERTPNDYQAVYVLVLKHPELLQGIIHDGQTFALLCVKRGYTDLLTRLINENSPVDLTTPCRVCGPENPETTVLHALFGQVRSMQWFQTTFPEDYIEDIKELTKLIINKRPDLLDMEIDRGKTARQFAYSSEVGHLVPSKPKSDDWEPSGPTLEDILAATAVENPPAKGSLEDKLITAIKSGNLKDVDALIAMHASLEARDSENMTPLMIVAKKGYADIAGRLINAGARVDAKDGYGCTALFYAIDGGHLEVVELLIANGVLLKI